MTTAPLKAADIYAYLPADTPWDIKCFDLLDSTSTYLQHITEEENAKGFTAVIADEQTAGRGRLGRPWHSPAGSGLWISLMFRPEFDSSRAPSITLMVAVAVAQALEDMGVKCGIKWPNDIFSPARRKLCGIRCEMRAEGDEVEYVIIGIGININNNAFPPELENIADSIGNLLGKELDRAEVAAALLKRMEENYALFSAEGFPAMREEWLSRAVGIGEQVKINGVGEVLYGIARGLDDYGFMLLEYDGKVEPVLAGDMIVEIK
ncbi:MAG: biotin--[Firmicutes bacterium]|nr:biotin--[acetyl-CoA-carboxylase] ligase [Bacillota bacterium]MBQ3112066.1 biotin--[acetyl-CoA-carboxylase] ligase [Bacillota bacterium]MBQ6842761.1 biotin--[acetyl-CoA-carboxylase] ligase [Bacillota bacterium]MBR6823490.1 biotin--[acetyl-CoA-carboxylase] ligase [Bacillota bacterium]MBR7113918.1 biotin--[acetyl-CoA-carboxylase] ligase [Bacillota bacterium]